MMDQNRYNQIAACQLCKIRNTEPNSARIALYVEEITKYLELKKSIEYVDNVLAEEVIKEIFG